MHEEGEGVEEMRTPCLQGGMGPSHVSAYVKKSLLHVFCSIFIRKVLLSYFVVFGHDFHCCRIKHLLLLFSSHSNVLQSFSLWNF